jgi:hypothetical protein
MALRTGAGNCGPDWRKASGTSGSAAVTVGGGGTVSGADIVGSGCDDAGLGWDSRSEAVAGVVFTVGLLRCRFFGVFFARAPFAVSTSADTSNVQRTCRPARTGGILIVCFGKEIGGAIHMPAGFPAKFVRSEYACLQDSQWTFNSTRGRRHLTVRRTAESWFAHAESIRM